MRLTLPLLAVAVLTTGCLVENDTYTLYLQPDGSADAVILQADVRSDEGDSAKAGAEEAAFLAEARVGAHAKARALEMLELADVRSSVLRDRVPFIVMTTAHLPRLDSALQRYFDALGLPAETSLSRSGTTMTLTIRIVADDSEMGLDVSDDNPLLSLIDETERYRLVLARGKFADARGFRLDEGDRVAVPLDVDTDEAEARGEVVYSLSWTTD